MEKELHFLKNYFEVITLKDFCKKYDLSYETVRRMFTGEKLLSEKIFDKMMGAIRQYEQEQIKLKDEFYNGRE